MILGTANATQRQVMGYKSEITVKRSHLNLLLGMARATQNRWDGNKMRDPYVQAEYRETVLAIERLERASLCDVINVE